MLTNDTKDLVFNVGSDQEISIKSLAELVRKINEVSFINDSKATNMDSALKSIMTYDRIRWIVGGQKKDGDKITIFNGKEQWEGKLNLSEATVKPERKTGFLEFVPDIHLYFSVLKNKQMNFLIEKVCEIGVKKIIPIKTEFSENFNLNINRLKKIAIEAVEQSDGIFVPEIEKVTPLTDVLKKWDDNRKIFFCDQVIVTNTA